MGPSSVVHDATAPPITENLKGSYILDGWQQSLSFNSRSTQPMNEMGKSSWAPKDSAPLLVATILNESSSLEG